MDRNNPRDKADNPLKELYCCKYQVDRGDRSDMKRSQMSLPGTDEGRTIPEDTRDMEDMIGKLMS